MCFCLGTQERSDTAADPVSKIHRSHQWILLVVQLYENMLATPGFVCQVCSCVSFGFQDWTGAFPPVRTFPMKLKPYPPTVRHPNPFGSTKSPRKHSTCPTLGTGALPCFLFIYLFVYFAVFLLKENWFLCGGGEAEHGPLIKPPCYLFGVHKGRGK